MDVSAEGGRVWESQLLQAVGTCQVFVALLAAAYRRWRPLERKSDKDHEGVH